MARYASEPLYLQYALGWNPMISPFCDGLGRDPYGIGESLLRSDAFGQHIDWVSLCLVGIGDGVLHGGQNYTGGLLMSTTGLSDESFAATHNKPMVDTQRVKRPTPAPPPRDYSSFTTWLADATERRQSKADLAHYFGGKGQNVNKWLKEGSVPNPATRKLVAEWAQVDDDELRALIDNHLINRPKKTSKKTGRTTTKPRSPSRKQER